MDDDDQSVIIQNKLYVSADETTITNSASNSNNVYAEVQKKPQTSKMEITNQEEFNEELLNGSALNHVYAVVNKTQIHQVNDEDTEPSRYKNQDGLVDARVDAKISDPSQPPILPPKRFSDPLPDLDRVVYSEVTTEL